jgi:hypothetical protein
MLKINDHPIDWKILQGIELVEVTHQNAQLGLQPFGLSDGRYQRLQEVSRWALLPGRWGDWSGLLRELIHQLPSQLVQLGERKKEIRFKLQLQLL